MEITNLSKDKNNLLERIFKLEKHNTNIKTEVMAGITTFMTMAYILVVNPMILSQTGMDQGCSICCYSFISSNSNFLYGYFS